MTINTIFLIIGGLSLFLFGINLMREALIKINSNKLKMYIEKATGSKFKALMTGIVASTLIQSSSGVSAIVIAFISAGMMNFIQGIMIMIGANVGTTTTAFIFSLEIENYSLIIFFVGWILYYFKKTKIKVIASCIMGVGLLFFGIFLMNEGFKEIEKTSDFLAFTLSISNSNIKSLVGGTLISALIQSSSATISITQSLYNLGAINLKSSICIMMGANIGTTIASLIPAIGASKTAKQTVYVNIIFNIVGVLFFLIFLDFFSDIMLYIESIKHLVPSKKLTVAYSHLIFNIISTFIIYFFIEKIIKLTKIKTD